MNKRNLWREYAIMVTLLAVLLIGASCTEKEAATSDPNIVLITNGLQPVRRVVDEGACVVLYYMHYGEAVGLVALPIGETNLHVDGCPLGPRPSQ